MKRSVVFVVFFLILGTALAGIYWSARRTKSSRVSSNAILQMTADAQRDISRGPMHLTRISDAREIAIGDDLARQYTSQIKELTPEEEATEAYVQRVGGALSLRAHRQLPYRFHLIADKNLINAFSLPGGHVFIGEGMLDLMETEDELASVLGHEIEHIDHYHCVERVQLEAKLKRWNLEVVGELLQIPMEFWQAGYQKDEEFEADREGMRLEVAAGYSPYGAVKMFERFAALCNEETIAAVDPADELSQLAERSLTGYFRSHPLPSERLRQAQAIIAQEHWEDRKAQRSFHVEYEVHNGKRVKSQQPQSE
jgi:predicted Zn-dependent protease